jgi:putative tryptophan/tyrosine transport system substrate-binding protein
LRYVVATEGDQMKRREAVLALLSAGAAPLAVKAQTERRVSRIGFLGLANAQANAARLPAFHAGMLALRWVEGRDYVIDARYTEGVARAAPGLAAELVATRPDLLLVPADRAALLFAQRTKTIPIVITISQDPIGNGLATSLRRPGGNVTGLTSLSTELSAKRLQLLKQAFPRTVHVVLLFEPDNAGSVAQAKEIERAAPLLGMRVSRIELRQPADIEPAFKRAAALGAQAYMVTQSGTIESQRHAIADHIVRLKVPAMFGGSPYVEAGGLMSYAASDIDSFRRAAAYVDKILKGANPGDLSIEQPTKFELIVNMKTARATGLAFTEAFMVGVDHAIE